MWSRPTWIETANPTVNDDRSAGFAQGVGWLNTVSGAYFTLEDDAIGGAVWTLIGTGVPAMRSGSDAVTTAGTVVAFGVAMANTNYSVVFYCYNGTGQWISCAITVRTVNGFTCTSAINGTLDWQVIAHA